MNDSNYPDGNITVVDYKDGYRMKYSILQFDQGKKYQLTLDIKYPPAVNLNDFGPDVMRLAGELNYLNDTFQADSADLQSGFEKIHKMGFEKILDMLKQALADGDAKQIEQYQTYCANFEQVCNQAEQRILDILPTTDWYHAA